MTAAWFSHFVDTRVVQNALTEAARLVQMGKCERKGQTAERAFRNRVGLFHQYLLILIIDSDKFEVQQQVFLFGLGKMFVKLWLFSCLNLLEENERAELASEGRGDDSKHLCPRSSETYRTWGKKPT